MPQTRCYIADPRCNDLFNTARADKLIELDIRNRRDQRQLPFPLADDFVTRRERNQRFQPTAHGDRHAVLHVRRNGLMEALNFRHGSLWKLLPVLFNLYGSNSLRLAAGWFICFFHYFGPRAI